MIEESKVCWLDCPRCGEELFESDAHGVFTEDTEARCSCGWLCRIHADGDSEDPRAWVVDVDESAVEMREAYAETLAELAQARDRWVPVSQRLPGRQPNGTAPMVVTFGDEGIDFGFWNGERWLGSDGTTRGVTHWLALEPTPIG